MMMMMRMLMMRMMMMMMMMEMMMTMMMMMMMMMEMMMMILIEVDDGYWRSKGRIISLVKRVITRRKRESHFFAFSQSTMMICTEIY